MTAAVANFRLLPEGRWHLGVLVKRTFRVVEGQRFAVAKDQPAPVDEETTAWKPATDVVVRGHVWAASGSAREQRASIEVASYRETVRATGDRVIDGFSGGSPVLSAPASFEKIPFTFDRCYGGFDRGAYERLGDAKADEGVRSGAELETVSRFTYARNRRGIGFRVAVDLARLVGAAVPNLDDPDDPVTPERLIRESSDDWFAAPRPVALDWIEPLDFPRSAHWGVPVDPRGSRLPELEEGTVSEQELQRQASFPPIPSPRALCGTRFGQRGLRLQGGEEVRIENMHSALAQVRASLPRERPAIRLQPPGCPWFDLDPQLDTVVLDLDEERLSMVWSAKLEVAGRYPDDELAQVVAEVRWP